MNVHDSWCNCQLCKQTFTISYSIPSNQRVIELENEVKQLKEDIEKLNDRVAELGIYVDKGTKAIHGEIRAITAILNYIRVLFNLNYP